MRLSLEWEEVAKIIHDPRLPTGLQLEEETVAALPRRLSLEEAVAKGTQDPTHPTGLHLKEMVAVI